jgi:hypothetical protein
MPIRRLWKRLLNGWLAGQVLRKPSVPGLRHRNQPHRRPLMWHGLDHPDLSFPFHWHSQTLPVSSAAWLWRGGFGTSSEIC